MRINIKKGLDIPLSGGPEQIIHEGPPVGSVALVATDYLDLKPTMTVAEGDRVRLGQPLFTDKQNPRVRYTAPAAGVVEAIHRGRRRAFRSLVIAVDGDEEETFARHAPDELASMDRAQVVSNLLDAGLWVALRTRPYSRIPAPESEPAALFVTATDTNPLAADSGVVIAAYQEDFANGLAVISRLTDGEVYVCCGPQTRPPPGAGVSVRTAVFTGPHPAGLVGTHIHYLCPVSARRTVWHIGYQDVIAVGRLFTTGRVWAERVISLAGPVVRNPRLLRVRLGANTDDLVNEELDGSECRVISGSILSGRRAAGWASYLGRYHTQVSVLSEGRTRDFLGWLFPAPHKFTALSLLPSAMRRDRRFALDTSQNGSPRAMLPIGSYEQVMPLDILPTQLLRALVTGDTDLAQRLGCLELDEEDLALCTFVSPSKYDYGPVLRMNLTQIEREG